MNTEKKNCVESRQDGHVRILTFSSAAKVNPLSPKLQEDLLAALSDIAEDSSVRAVVLTGAGKTFCVGADLSQILAEDGHSGSSTSERVTSMLTELSNPLVMKLRQFPVPVICALNGAAAGAGVGLALSADLVVAAESAFFSVPFMPGLGLVPDMGSSWFLTRYLNPMQATALMLTGERVDGKVAEKLGLIYRCVPDEQLMSIAIKLAQQLARLPSHAMAEIRGIVASAQIQPLHEQLQVETVRQSELLNRPTFEEGVRAFLERRSPEFHGSSIP